MKRLLLILLPSIIIYGVTSAQSGTKVTSSIVPNSFLDNYATHQAKFGKGGYQSVKNATARNAIFSSRRDTGMLVYVSSEDKIYILKGGIANSNWEELKLGNDISTDTVAFTKNALSITTSGYTYTFRTNGTNSNYSVFVNTYDNNGNPVDSRWTKTNNSITVYPAVNCKLDALIVLNGFSQGTGSGSGGGAVSSVNGQTGAVIIDKASIDLGNVDNTPDAGKPISTATQNALNLKLNISDTTKLHNQIAYSLPVTIPYSTEIPFVRALTIITGKSLTTNDVFTIGANPIEGGGAQLWLDGDGSHVPDFSAFDYMSGEFVASIGIRNLITMIYIGGEVYISILNVSAI